MIRNAFATRLATLAGIALSAAGFTALEAGAQGTVTLSGGTGNSCAYSSITVAPNGNLNVACSNTGNTPPVCSISGPTSANVGQAFSLTANCNPSATSYTWTGASSTAASVTVTPQVAGTLSFTVTGTNANGTGSPSATHNVAVTSVQAPTDVPKNCTFSANPATPIAGQATTISINCTNSPNVFAWYQYEGGALNLPQQTTAGSQTVTFPASGKYSWWLQAGNQLGGGDVFSGSVNVSGTSGCPAVPDVVGPLSSASLLNLRFDLRPGQTGTQEFTLPLDGFTAARITGTPATASETPKSTVAEVWVSDCPGHKPADLPAGCMMELWGSTGQANFYVGSSPWSSCPATGRKYVNIKHKVCNPSGGGINYCSNYLKVSGQ
jgi:hypothetical protein